MCYRVDRWSQAMHCANLLVDERDHSVVVTNTLAYKFGRHYIALGVTGEQTEIMLPFGADGFGRRQVGQLNISVYVVTGPGRVVDQRNVRLNNASCNMNGLLSSRLSNQSIASRARKLVRSCSAVSHSSHPASDSASDEKHLNLLSIPIVNSTRPGNWHRRFEGSCGVNILVVFLYHVVPARI